MRDIEDGEHDGEWIITSDPAPSRPRTVPRWLAWVLGKD